MSRAATKVDLINDAGAKFEQLFNLIASMSDEELSSTFDFSGSASKKEAHWQRDKNVKDVLVHLYEWHQLLLKWVEANQSGEAAPFLPPPYNWKTYGKMNVEFWQKHQATSLSQAKEMLSASHRQAMEQAEKFTNEELFEKKHFAWTGNSTLGTYFVANTASHYDWALRKLKAHLSIYRKGQKNK